MSEQKIIKKSEILKMQEEGMTREEIAKHYQVTDLEMSKYFKFLKINTKAKKKLKYILYNDVDSTLISAPEIKEEQLEIVN